MCSSRPLLIIALVGVFTTSLSAEDLKPQRPNIVFLLSDDQRADQMRCAGHPILLTPTMDRLAANGTRFRNAFVTTSICAASRATILTGLYERSHKFTFGTIPISKEDSGRSYPALLRNVGYRTGFIGKFGVAVHAGQKESMFDYFKPLNRNPYFKPQKGGGKRHITQICGDLADEFLKAQKKDKPFCLSISFNAPHAEDSDKKDHYPWPKVVDGLYKKVKVPPPPLSDPKIFESQPKVLKDSMNRDRWFWRWDTPEKYQKNIKGYYRMISGVDHTMGRVLEMLQKYGFDKNTIVIFSADNGYYLGSRGFAGKWSHYEESLRIPLIVYDPRLPRNRGGAVADQMALNVDIPATILDYAQVKVPKGYQGRSLKAIASGQSPREWRTDFFCEHLMHHPRIPKWEGVRDQRWVYARYFEQKPPFEFLHDLKTDPRQLKNFATDPKHARQLAMMQKRCNKLRDQYGGEYSREKFPRRGDRRKPKKTGKGSGNNVLFIAMDDLNDWIGCLKGHPQAKTPNLDRLAKTGMLFTNAHCNPSRTSLMHGLYPSTSGVTGNQQDWRKEASLKGRDTLPQYFKKNGYFTGAAGKLFHANHGGPRGALTGWHGGRQGFNHPPSWTERYPSKKVQIPLPVVLAGQNWNGLDIWHWDWGPFDHPDSATTDGRTSDWVVKQLQRKHDKPFFLAAGIYKPHGPWYCPRPYFEKHPKNGIKLPVVKEDDIDDIPKVALGYLRNKNHLHARILQHKLYQSAVQAYLANITFADAMLGKILDALEKSPYAKNTIVCLWSDHGWHLGEKQRWHKSTLWEEATRVPLIIRAPGMTRAGSHSAQPVSLVDLYPTLTELCQLPAKEKLDGESLVPLLKNPMAKRERPAITMLGNGNKMSFSARSDRWRYTRYHNGSEELYDHNNDPNEWHNLAEKSEHQAVKKALAKWFPRTSE